MLGWVILVAVLAAALALGRWAERSAEGERRTAARRSRTSAGR